AEVPVTTICKRLAKHQVILPFRPALVPLEGSDADEARELFAIPGGVGLKKNSRVEQPEKYSSQLVRGSTLYGKKRIEYALQGFDEESRTVIKIVRFGENLCGHSGIVHGGLISAFFDDAFGTSFWIESKGEYTGVTANLSVNYRKPMPAPSNVAFILWVDRIEGRKVYLKAEARSVASTECDSEAGKHWIEKDSILYAEATALFIKLNKEEEKAKLQNK
ncbi:hypothetical protein HDU98_000192, partial [Podochytrium sp. JEL0797]